MSSQPSSTTSLSATLRPRTRRLISLDDGFEDSQGLSSSSASTHAGVTSSFYPLGASPIPSRHPSRTSSAARSPPRSSLDGLHASNGLLNSPTTPSTFTSTLWGTSWSSIQSIASTLLGNDIPSDLESPGLPRPRRSLDSAHARRYNLASPVSWGPSNSVEHHIAAGSQEDRLAQVQAKKRESLLTANGFTAQDSTGKHKRKLSADRNSIMPSTEEDDSAVLVYLHVVQPSDTLAGVAIKYHCPAAMFRKVNRLWPNDSIQIRKTVFLPVDACGVKGRRLPDPTETADLIGRDMYDENTPVQSPTAPRGKLGISPTLQQPQALHPLSAASLPPTATTASEEPFWTHDSWVQIDTFPHRVQIARLPRRTLGFFPPSRRKSIHYSDHDSPPYSSIGFPSPPTPPISTSTSRLASPLQPSPCSLPASHILRGPGGVGTFDFNVRSPGPAPDKLYQFFAAHLPNGIPPTSLDSTHSASSSGGIENVGGAIEGWVRKMATKAAAVVQTPPLGGKSGLGDLIELMEGWELDGGVDPSLEAQGSEGIDGGGTGIGSATDQGERESMLTERFPARGRVFGEDRRKNV